MRHWTIGLVSALVLALPGGAQAAPKPASQAPSGSCVTHTAGGYPAVSCSDKTWHCTSLQKSTQVDVEISDTPTKLDAVHLDSGCTGNIRVAIDQDSGDGIKVHAGVHDLTIWGYISCTAKHGNVHQDGIQAMGGERVTLKWVRVNCPTGNNGGLFVNAGNGGNGIPTDIVAEHGTFFEGNASIHVGPNSLRSGARWVQMRTNRTPASPSGCIRVDKLAQSPVDTGNVCLTPK